MNNIYAQFWFDTEDFITPEADDALYLLLVMLKEKKIPVTFKIVAEKARMLERRSRYDIIGLLRSCDNFEIGYHTDLHSYHPTVSEYCETMGFEAGRAAFFARENPGRLDVERITGKKCLCYGQPGNSWSPQSFPALKQMDIKLYMDCHDVIDGGRKPYWFGGLLNYLDVPWFRMDLSPDYAQNIQKAREEYKTRFADLAEKGAFINVFYHPCEFSCTEFYDLNFAYGKNPPRENWKTAKLRPAEEMRGLVDNLSEYLDFMIEQGVKIISASDLLKMAESAENKNREVPEKIVRAWAEKASDSNVDYIVQDGFSISCVEGLSLAACKVLNKPLICSFAYGPEKDFKSFDNINNINSQELAKIIYEFFESNRENNKENKIAMLPDAFEIPGAKSKISPLDAAVLLACEICGQSQSEFKSRLCPAERVTKNDDWSGWIIHEQDFKAHNILELARLQMWTFKPAVFL